MRLTVEGLHAGYGPVRVLHGLDLELGEGECVALLGTNGNGKSTLLKCIAGLVRPAAGGITLTVDGQTHDLTRLDTPAIVDLGVVMVPEGRRLFPRSSVHDNLLLGAYRPAARARLAANLDVCFEAFPVLRERARQPAGSLSGGQQQMLAVARALMAAPRLLLVDEPSTGLSPALVRQTLSVVDALRRRLGIPVLMAEQNFHEAARVADRGYIMVHGRIAFEGRDVSALREAELVRRHYLGADTP